ncbi:hypothetical protein CRG98_033506 [Punica granatum]|uniref:Peptidase S9 prolyl oligopeptidase catalytic domain-containing protein n=1 Tax=Punica granatum TaxID=22663 RepID=A0A2I0IQ23_PUNGR|nr:hypothetical protein CRG98_033506 [Punica granatum]
MASSSASASPLSSSRGVEMQEPTKQERFTAPFVSWKSPITSDIVSGASKRLGSISVAGDGDVYKHICIAGSDPILGNLQLNSNGPLEAVGNHFLYIEGALGVLPSSVAKVSLDSEKVKIVNFCVICSSSPDVLKYKPYFCIPELIEFPTKVPGQNAYAYFYPPSNPTYRVPEVESWKMVGDRLFITGGSAGGYTTLAALAFRETFRVGASLYGVGSDKNYNEKSPINFVEKFSCPIILFQGLEDKVVTPDQAGKIYHVLQEKGSPVALVEYEGEQHGFRKLPQRKLFTVLPFKYVKMGEVPAN